VHIAGGINIARDMFEGFPTLDPEWVLEQNPDAIILVVTSKLPSSYDCDDPVGMEWILDDLTSCPERADVSAVENERVHIVASDIRCEVQQEYLRRFQRIDFKVGERGVFVYPETKR
jgi:iron complex transport system substrate-binding protein